MAEDKAPSGVMAAVLAAAGAEQPKLASLVNAMGPVMKPLKVILGITIDYVVPVYVSAFKYACQLYERLPVDIFSSIVGLGLAVFDGFHKVGAGLLAGTSDAFGGMGGVLDGALTAMEVRATDTQRRTPALSSPPLPPSSPAARLANP